MSRDGAQWTDSDGTRHTVNSTDDPQAPGGFCHSQSSPNGDKATAVSMSASNPKVAYKLKTAHISYFVKIFL